MPVIVPFLASQATLGKLPLLGGHPKTAAKHCSNQSIWRAFVRSTLNGTSREINFKRIFNVIDRTPSFALYLVILDPNVSHSVPGDPPTAPSQAAAVPRLYPNPITDYHEVR
jgi:hypothetical protein